MNTVFQTALVLSKVNSLGSGYFTGRKECNGSISALFEILAVVLKIRNIQRYGGIGRAEPSWSWGNT